MRRIVVLSDGTGNSAGKVFRTNVWHFYQALDLSGPKQIAHYDDGVGSSSFKPWAILAGAVGWGLKRNILDLYMFLCRNYQVNSNGVPIDEIHAIGFSRGAFTIRVLINFVLSEGLVADALSEDDLKRKSRYLYRKFRRKQKTKFGLAQLGRWVRDCFDFALEIVARRKRPSKPKTSTVPNIAFVGVWDTVDAYGLPINEIKVGIDKYLWPLKLDDRELDDRILKARHALSIDDRRKTFHPLLWNEPFSFPKEHTDTEKLVQVWFAGAHANVGGGYPDDALSHISLNWMIGEAEKNGLEFDNTALKNIRAIHSPLGRSHNSRASLAAYYRYEPRWLARPQDRQGACINRPKIHESVFLRILLGSDDYAPLSFPDDFQIVIEPRVGSACTTLTKNLLSLDEYLAHLNRTIKKDDHVALALQDKIEAFHLPTKESLKLIWDTVWWRRVVYFATVFFTLILIAFPWLPQLGPGFLSWILAYPLLLVFIFEQLLNDLRFIYEPLLEAIPKIAESTLPSFVKPWIDAYRDSRQNFILFVVIIVALNVLGALIDRRVQDRARSAWSTTWAVRRYEWFRQSLRTRYIASIAIVGISSIFLIWSLWLLHGIWEYWTEHKIHCSYVPNEECTILQKVFWFISGFEDAVVFGNLIIFLWMLIFFVLPLSIWSTLFLKLNLSKEQALNSELPGFTLWIARKVRESKPSQILHHCLKEKLLPLFGAGAVILFLLLAANRLFFEYFNARGLPCESRASANEHPEFLALPLTYNVACQRSEFKLEENQRYVVAFVSSKLGSDPWNDWSDLKSQTDPITLALSIAPVRRRLEFDWYLPVLEVGSGSNARYFALKDKPIIIQNRYNEEVQAYLNDGVLGARSYWSHFYSANVGEGTIIFKKIPGPDESISEEQIEKFRKKEPEERQENEVEESKTNHEGTEPN